MEPYQPRPNSASLPYVIAHRGISGKAPENTLSSFSRAVSTPGVKMIELDVRISQDDQIIVLHDRTLQRTSTGNGAARNYTLKELKEFDAGSWFHPSFASERIPTLAEVLHLAKGKTWVNIELKRDLFSRAQDVFVQRVIETVRAAGIENEVLYSSFTHDLLAQVRRIEPKAVTGVIYNIYRDFGRSPSKLAGRVHASVFVCAKHELRKSMIRDARQHGLALYVYTLNSIQDARKMIQLGVDGIISDNADGIVAALGDRM
ncbi:MAG: hypothetical protein M1339_06375 [Bacteroidetes bacterium]|nr:hypothetical protein [Bacteroidota bacterium]